MKLNTGIEIPLCETSIEVRTVKHRSRTNPVKPNKGMQMFLSTLTQTQKSPCQPRHRLKLILIWKCPCQPQHRHGNLPVNPNTNILLWKCPCQPQHRHGNLPVNPNTINREMSPSSPTQTWKYAWQPKHMHEKVPGNPSIVLQ